MLAPHATGFGNKPCGLTDDTAPDVEILGRTQADADKVQGACSWTESVCSERPHRFRGISHGAGQRQAHTVGTRNRGSFLCCLLVAVSFPIPTTVNRPLPHLTGSQGVTKLITDLIIILPGVTMF